jgi:hypothetical protein
LVELKEVTMRLVHAGALAAAALLLASVASAQGLGDAAAREKEKRKTSAKPAKVFTESDLPPSSAPAASQPAAGTSPDGKPADGKAAEGQAADGKTKPKTEAELEAEAEKERQKVVEDWRAKLDDARKQEQQYKDQIDRIQLYLNDNSGLYTTGRARSMASQDEAKQKLAEVQARIADLEDQGRRSGYR